MRGGNQYTGLRLHHKFYLFSPPEDEQSTLFGMSSLHSPGLFSEPNIFSNETEYMVQPQTFYVIFARVEALNCRFLRANCSIFHFPS